MYNNLKRAGLLPRETDYDETDYGVSFLKFLKLKI